MDINDLYNFDNENRTEMSCKRPHASHGTRRTNHHLAYSAAVAKARMASYASHRVHTILSGSGVAPPSANYVNSRGRPFSKSTPPDHRFVSTPWRERMTGRQTKTGGPLDGKGVMLPYNHSRQGVLEDLSGSGSSGGSDGSRKNTLANSKRAIPPSSHGHPQAAGRRGSVELGRPNVNKFGATNSAVRSLSANLPQQREILHAKTPGSSEGSMHIAGFDPEKFKAVNQKKMEYQEVPLKTTLSDRSTYRDSDPSIITEMEKDLQKKGRLIRQTSLVIDSDDEKLLSQIEREIS